ncbi:hypothetical protein AB0I28_36665 [Phytomonospora sp. NPDC050363]|uniref:hypothetical protein n=1 Tax=Phytomonospora sp. NPDC050363 TaxID=3155642 RepID=UPI0033E35912
MTAEPHDGTHPTAQPAAPQSQTGPQSPAAPQAPFTPPAAPLPAQSAATGEYSAAPGAPAPYVASPPPLGLSSLWPHTLAVTGVFAILVAVFAPLASNGDPATNLRTVDLPFLTPIFGLVVLVFATAAMCHNPRFLGFGRATAPLLGLLLSAAVGAEIFQWGAQVPNPQTGLAYMVDAGMYFLIGGILLLSWSVLPMRPATLNRSDQPAG